MNETKIDLTKTDPTKKTNAEPTADVKPIGMMTWETIRTMSSEELCQLIKALEDEHKADMRALRSWQRALALLEEKA